MNVYPAIHELHFVGLFVEHVAHGKLQLRLHVDDDVKKNPDIHCVHVVDDKHEAQLVVQAVYTKWPVW